MMPCTRHIGMNSPGRLNQIITVTGHDIIQVDLAQEGKQAAVSTETRNICSKVLNFRCNQSKASPQAVQVQSVYTVLTLKLPQCSSSVKML